MKKVNIIGANLGGITAAILLGRAGWSVELFDRLDRNSLAIDWVENFDLSVFDRLELELPPADCYRKKKNWAFVSPDGAHDVVAYSSEDSKEVLIDRHRLTEYLLSLAEANATFHFGEDVTELVVDSGRVSGVRVNGVFLGADLTIDCTGSLSGLRQQLPKFYGISPAPDSAAMFHVERGFYEWGDGAPIPKQTNKMYLRRNSEPSFAWCLSDVRDYSADVLVAKIGAVGEEEVMAAVDALRESNPIIGNEMMKAPVDALIPSHRYMTKMVVPGYVILGSTPYMNIPLVTPPLSDTMDGARILAEVLTVNNSCKTDDLYVYQVRFCREYIAKEVAADVFRRWLMSVGTDDLNFLFESEIIDGDFLSDLLSGVLPSITTKGRGFFGKGVKRPSVVNSLRAVLTAMKHATDLVQSIPSSYNKTTYMKWQADVDALCK